MSVLPAENKACKLVCQSLAARSGWVRRMLGAGRSQLSQPTAAVSFGLLLSYLIVYRKHKSWVLGEMSWKLVNFFFLNAG